MVPLTKTSFITHLAIGRRQFFYFIANLMRISTVYYVQCGPGGCDFPFPLPLLHLLSSSLSLPLRVGRIFTEETIARL